MAGSSGAGDNQTGQNDNSDAELAGRFNELSRELEQRRLESEGKSSQTSDKSSGYSEAVKISSEFIAGIVVGGFIGWAVDKWFDISPFGLVVFLLLGFAAGVLNVLRAVGPKPTGDSDDEEH